MKNERGGFRQLRREHVFEELVHDSYKSSRKLHEPTRCPECGAVYRKGRWTWGMAPADAHEEKCPACHRIHDKFPAGYVTLKGGFLREHRDQIVQLVKNHEEKEQAEHPLERIMRIEDTDDGVLVTTTDAHLARDIAEALHNAYKGDLDYHYNKADNLLRASWSR